MNEASLFSRRPASSIAKRAKLIGWIVVVIFIVTLGSAFVGGCGTALILGNVASNGERVGYLQKISEQHGWVANTWEGELALGGFGGSHIDKPGQSGPGTWSFTCSAEIGKECKKLSGSLVVIEYDELRWVPKWKGNTNYFAKSVKALDEGRPPSQERRNGR